MPFIIIFFILPFVEIAVFMKVGDEIGLMTTLILAFATAVIGGLLVRHQGLQTLFSLRRNVEAGQMPVREIFDGFCLVAAGALLIIPGFVTDTAGFLLLIPQIREILRRAVAGYLEVRVTGTKAKDAPASSPHRPASGGVIEGEYKRIDEDKPD